MASDRRGLWVTVCTSLGLAALAFAWLPGPWPNPLPEGALADEPALSRLRAAAASVDAACAAGDVGGFTAATTAAMRQQLAGRLRATERRLDAATLRELATAAPWTPWLQLPVLALEVRGDRAAVAVERPAGEGAQVLQFVWDGQRFCCDGTHQASAVRDASGARAVLRDAVLRRER
ncbi:MAG: hypothetical protein IT455_18075 [Planctomycetes bacterium]|nr:hypothetical protein [Planctomycetota bacterium]